VDLHDPELTQVSMDWMRKVDVLEYWPGVSVASASAKFELPAVMRVRFYVQRTPKRTSTMISRRNIFIRDQYTCQCAPAFHKRTLQGTELSFQQDRKRTFYPAFGSMLLQLSADSASLKASLCSFCLASCTLQQLAYDALLPSLHQM
jgi:hypothetical protein